MARTPNRNRPTNGRPATRRRGRRTWTVVAGLVLLGATATPVEGQPVAAARVIHVSPGGNDGASGDAHAPVRTVGRAVQLAASGDAVEIATGTYHESVQVYAKQVHLRAAPGADVVFDGSRPVGGWTASGGDWWSPWTTDFARAGLPHVYAHRPEAGWPEQFFLDGQQLAEVTSRAAVVPGTFFHDRAADRVWIGDDPAGRLVEGSDLPWGIYLNHADGSSVRDIDVRRYATPFSKMAAVRAYANDLVLDGLDVSDNAYMGVSAIGDRIAVRNTTARANGHLGMHAHQSTDLSIVAATLLDNNREDFDAWHAAGGVKVTNTTRFTMTDSLVVGNGGPGIWTDLDVIDVVIARNFARGNARSGIEIELSSDVVVVDNTAVANGEAGVWVLESSATRVWHNALFGNKRDIWVEDGPRSDVNDVDLFANTLGGGSAGAPGLLNVDDWTGARSAAEMDVVANHNAYWLPPGSPTPYLSRWANWPYPLALSATIDAHRAATGQDAAGLLSRDPSNPFVRDAASSDYRQPAGAPLAAPLPADVAAAAGVAAGSQFPAGPLAAWGAPPSIPEPEPEPEPDPDPPPPIDPPAVLAGAGSPGRGAVRIPVAPPPAESNQASEAHRTEPLAAIAAETPDVAEDRDGVPAAGWRALTALVASSV